MVRRFNSRLKILKKSSQIESSTFHSWNKTDTTFFFLQLPPRLMPGSSLCLVLYAWATNFIFFFCMLLLFFFLLVGGQLLYNIVVVFVKPIFKNWQFSVILPEFNFSHSPTIFIYLKEYSLPLSCLSKLLTLLHMPLYLLSQTSISIFKFEFAFYFHP